LLRTLSWLWPVGPIGKPTELQLAVPILAFNFTNIRTPRRRCRLHAGEGNYDKWLTVRALSHHTLNAYDNSPCGRGPEETRCSASQQARASRSGIARRREGGDRDRDFLIVDMFANYCTGRETPGASVTNGS